LREHQTTIEKKLYSKFQIQDEAVITEEGDEMRGEIFQT
jgi:hypothetical protein